MEQTGSWKSIAVFLSDEKVQGNVASLWIEHGLKFHEYAYAVYPGLPKEIFKERVKNPKFKILSNDESVQAIWFDNNQLQMIFHRPTKFVIKPFGNMSVEVNKPVAIMMNKTSKGITLFTSAPNQKIAEAEFKFEKKGKKSQKITIRYPVEQKAGSTVMKTFDF
jgi:hypothetical protein